MEHTKIFAVIVCILTCFGSTQVYAQGSETKDEWAAKILGEQRISQALCADGSHMLTCTSEYTDEINGAAVRKTIGQAECIETVNYLTKTFLHDGKNDSKPAMFYLKLPTNIGAGYQMNYYAGELAKQSFAQINQLLQQKCGSLIRSQACDQKLLEAFTVNGN